MGRISDNAERAQALAPRGSFIVQAPAGSGKTGLLIQRYLALLPSVHEPEEILAITFTRKAASEMKHRVLAALTEARDEVPVHSSHDRFTRDLARRALAHDRDRGWNLLENSARIQARTVDAYCASVVRAHPFASGLGGQPETIDDATFLFEEAVSRLFQRTSTELEAVLWHLDNEIRLLRDLLVEMLHARDQWSRPLPEMVDRRGARGVTDRLRSQLENTLRGEVESALEKLEALVPLVLREAGPGLIGHAAVHLDQELPPTRFPRARASDLELWHRYANLLLTNQGSLRSRLDKRHGFPVGSPELKELKARAMTLISELTESEHRAFVHALSELRALPPVGYTETQWQVTEALLLLLQQLLDEVRGVFGRRRIVDHSEIASAALRVLRRDHGKLQHLLVDEFQDTSTTQFQLIQSLVKGWKPGDGRTVLLVGDPMQSIYRFREAEVGLYLRCWRNGIGALSPGRLQLRTNFRSVPGVVTEVNRIFAEVMPEQEDGETGAVPYAPFEAGRSESEDSSAAEAPTARAHERAVQFHCWYGDSPQEEAQRVEQIVRQAKSDGLESVAVIGRYRHHLYPCLSHLRDAGLRYRAVDLDRLAERPVVQDLLALTEVLVSPAHRLAWLVLLRGPWGGLSLSDLLELVGNDARPIPVIWRDGERMSRLSSDGRARVARVKQQWDRCYEERARRSLRRSVEGLWLSLGGPAAADARALEDAALYLDLLQSVERAGELPSARVLERRLADYFAPPDPLADGWLEAMTIHKAKGLEFDCVIAPGLGRSQKGDDSRLLLWQERFVGDGAEDVRLLLAPIRSKRDAVRDPIYDYVSKAEGTKSKHELQRLLYVACTRAGKRLHLLGHLSSSHGEWSPLGGSALAVLSPGCLEEFVHAAGAPPEPAAEEAARPSAPRIERRRMRSTWSLPAPEPDVGEVPPWLGTSVPPTEVPEAEVTSVEVSSTPLPGESSTNGDPTEPESTGVEARAVGVVLHRVMERLALDGVEAWTEEKLRSLEPGIAVALVEEGVASDDVARAGADVVNLAMGVLSDQRGRWILERHSEQESEVELAGVLNGQFTRCRVDRTFVQDGTRWIIDYKTSARRVDPRAADGREPRERFQAREVKEHRAQLEAYRTLFEAQGAAHSVRTGLYFVRYALFVEVS